MLKMISLVVFVDFKVQKLRIDVYKIYEGLEMKMLRLL